MAIDVQRREKIALRQVSNRGVCLHRVVSENGSEQWG